MYLPFDSCRVYHMEVVVLIYLCVFVWFLSESYSFQFPCVFVALCLNRAMVPGPMDNGGRREMRTPFANVHPLLPLGNHQPPTHVCIPAVLYTHMFASLLFQLTSVTSSLTIVNLRAAQIHFLEAAIWPRICPQDVHANLASAPGNHGDATCHCRLPGGSP